MLSDPRLGLRPEAALDVRTGRLDRRLLAALLALSQRFQLDGVGPCVSGHSTYVAGTNRISNHTAGRACDVGSVNGQLVRASSPAARQLVIAAASLPAAIRPTEIGSPFVLVGCATRNLRPPAWAAGTSSRRRPRQWQIPHQKSPAPRLIVASRADGASPAPPGEAESTDEAVREQPAVVATIALLGPVTIDGVRRPRRATTVELLAYLALHPKGASRDELLEAMWPGEDPQRTRSRLWQGVTEARRLLGDAFDRDGDRYQLDRTRVAVDVDDLEHLLARIDDAPAGDVGLLVERALGLWRGEPLSGTEYAWVDGRVRQLEATLSTLAEQAARTRLQAGDTHGALHVAEQGLGFDDLNETFVRIALEAEAALGRREAVTTRYERLRQQLDDRLGLKPERATRLLYRQLLRQE